MTSMSSSLNLSNAPVVCGRALPPAKLRLPEFSTDALKHFKQEDGKFSCYGGQMIESASPIYNLYRAAQLRFPGEEILEEATKFAYNFLQEKIANNQIQEKWVISEHLIDEIKLGLKMPWYATLPRVEAAYYLQYYAGTGDVWIGKTFYRMPEISNDTYKELAVLDFNRCQAQHQFEWIYMQECIFRGSRKGAAVKFLKTTGDKSSTFFNGAKNEADNAATSSGSKKKIKVHFSDDDFATAVPYKKVTKEVSVKGKTEIDDDELICI